MTLSLPHLGYLRISPQESLLAGVLWLLTCFSLEAQRKPSVADLEAAHTAMTAGMAAVQKNDLAEARREFTRAATLAPKVSATHAALGSVLLGQNDLGAALRELNLAHTLDPADISIRLNLARTNVALRRFSAAVILFRDVLAGGSAPALLADESIAYATALAATGDAGKAESVLRIALVDAPDSSALQDALGTVVAQTGRVEQALPLFERALVADPSNTQAQYHKGVALLTLNRPEEAIAPLELAASTGRNGFDSELQLGRALSALHRDGEALAHLHRAADLRDAATPVQSVYALALALQASGDAKAALPLFDVALADPAFADGSSMSPAQNSNVSSALINAALAYVQTGDTVHALPLYTRALQLGPDSATLREDFGVAYLQQSNLVHAIEEFKAGITLEPDNAHLHYDLGLALKLKDDLASAVPEMERAAQLDPNLPDPSYTLGVIYMQQGRFQDAATQLKNAVALQPEYGNAWALLGSVLKDSGDPPGATDALKKAVILLPDQPSLHIQLAALESQAGQTEAAASERKIAADLSRAAITRQRANFALKSARALLEDNKLSEAILQLNNAAQADPTLAEPHHLLAEAYTRQGKPADAAVERQRASAIDVQRAKTDGHP